MGGCSGIRAERWVGAVVAREVGGICPFNFPAMIPLWMYPPAVTAGNTFLLKPSERVPLTGVRLAEMAHDCGLPPGVLNVVHGANDTVNCWARLGTAPT